MGKNIFFSKSEDALKFDLQNLIIILVSLKDQFLCKLTQFYMHYVHL